ncbi:MAG: lysylphosphatidylglycerol synthase domain-containing protein, partial [Candidatus Latescibacteria bacterium]|nr:lysylphosphatidylglycerol synthase domain-containing protein [Candidatus Latescibacterota bacterium]
MASIRSFSGYLGIFISTIVLNTMYWLSILLPFFSFQFHINYGLNPFDALVVMTIATIGVILPTPGGTGTYHLFCRQALVQLYGVPVSEAMAFATVAHALAIVAFLLFGGPSLLRMVLKKETKKEDAE